MTQVSRLDVFLGLDSASFEQGARQARSQFQQLERGVTASSTRLLDAQNRVAAGTQKLRASYQQLGFQLQDVVIQLGMGARPLQVLTQQGSQLLGALGPAPALFGAVGAAIAIVADTMLRLSSEAQAAAQAQKALDEALERSKVLLIDTAKSVDDLALAYAKLRKVQKVSEAISLEANLRSAEDAAAAARQQVFEMLDNIQLFSELNEIGERMFGPNLEPAAQPILRAVKILEKFKAGGDIQQLVADLEAMRSELSAADRDSFSFIDSLNKQARAYVDAQRQVERYQAALRLLRGEATAADRDLIFPEEAAKRRADAIEKLVDAYPDVTFPVSPDLDVKTLKAGMDAAVQEARRLAEREAVEAQKAAERLLREELAANRQRTEALLKEEKARLKELERIRLEEEKKETERLNRLQDEGKRLTEQYASGQTMLAERLRVLREALSRGFIDQSTFDKATMDAQRDAVDRQIEQLRNYGTAWDGVRAALLRYQADAQRTSEVASQLTSTGLDGVERGLAGLLGLVAQGKTSWQELGQAATQALQMIVEELARVFIRQQLITPLLGSLFGGGAAIFGGAGGDIVGGAGVGGDRLAKGGVVHRGVVTPFAAGGVVRRPTLFPMRDGVGLMGEAGPEGVFPLRRNRRGELGVQAEMAAPIVQIIDQRSTASPDIQVAQGRGPNGEPLVQAYIRDAVGREIARGAMRAPMRQEFGLRPALHPRG